MILNNNWVILQYFQSPLGLLGLIGRIDIIIRRVNLAPSFEHATSGHQPYLAS